MGVQHPPPTKSLSTFGHPPDVQNDFVIAKAGGGAAYIGESSHGEILVALVQKLVSCHQGEVKYACK